MKNKLYILLFIVISYKTTAQITYIPDQGFEQKLIDLGIDSDGIINGEILTSDALAVTSLSIFSLEGNATSDWIYDLTGIEAFINIEFLEVNNTMIEELDISTLTQLKHLNCYENNLTSIDVSNNILLEYVRISEMGDVAPMNHILELDLSNNPNIHTIIAVGATKINLKNGNNNSNTFLNVSSGNWGMPPDYIDGHVCIEVDNADIAQSNGFPYSEWIIYHVYRAYSYTNDVEACALNVTSFSQNKIKLYPNPVSNILYFDKTDTIIEKVIIFDLSGRKILEQNQVNSVSVSTLQKGNYILKIFSDKGIQIEKIIVK